MGAPSLVPSPSAIPIPVPTWTWEVSTWSPCGDQCWLPGGTYKTRTVQCVETSSSGTASVVDPSQCSSRGLDPPQAVLECAAGSCEGAFWLAANDWSPCSQRCIANVSDPTSLGVSVSSPPRCFQMNGTAQQVPEAMCGLQTLPTQRPCNRYLCPKTIASWSVGPWSACVAHCTMNVGVKTRPVRCTNSSGTTLPDAVCLSLVPGAPKPVGTIPCANSSVCTCSTDGDCGSSRWVCDTLVHTCRCSSDWDGNDCSIPLLRAPPGASSCDDGVVDTAGTCCVGFIDASSGLCCPSGSEVDRAGRCCTNGSVDVCGVCNGTSVAVDMFGVCCSTALPPTGMCCVGAKVDSCGVCGGSNTCAATISITLNATAVDTGTVVTHLDALTSSGSPRPPGVMVIGPAAISAALGVDPSSIGPVVTTADHYTLTFMLAAQADVPEAASNSAVNATLDSSSSVSAVPVSSPSPSHGLSDADLAGRLMAALKQWVFDIAVQRVSDCGNGVCELGESECVRDCPAPVGSCPTARSLVCGGHGHCLGAVSTYCECYTGYSGSACEQCAGGYLFRGGWCVFPPGALSTGSCSDGVRNGHEDGVDCGGECAAACTVMNNHGAGGSMNAVVAAVSALGGVALVIVVTVVAKRRCSARAAPGHMPPSRCGSPGASTREDRVRGMRAAGSSDPDCSTSRRESTSVTPHHRKSSVVLTRLVQVLPLPEPSTPT